MAASEDDLDVLAGEYVLGVLAAEERAAVERRLADHPELAQRIAAWHERLAPLAADLPEVTPRPQVWQQVRRSLTALSPKQGTPWRSRLGLWRAWAGLATTAALGLLLAVLLLPRPAPQLVAVLSDRAAGQSGSCVRRPRPADCSPGRWRAAPATRVPELWLLPAAGRRRSRWGSSTPRQATVAPWRRDSPRCSRPARPGGQPRAARRLAHRCSDRPGRLHRHARGRAALAAFVHGRVSFAWLQPWRRGIRSSDGSGTFSSCSPRATEVESLMPTIWTGSSRHAWPP